MTAKEYLGQAALLRRRIKQVEDRIEEIRTEASSPKAIRYDKDMIQSSPAGDALDKYIIRLDAEERKLIRLKVQYLDTWDKIRKQLAAVTPGIYSDLLYMRYLEEKSLGQISEELNYSYEWTCRLHGKALHAFAQEFGDTYANKS